MLVVSAAPASNGNEATVAAGRNWDKVRRHTAGATATPDSPAVATRIITARYDSTCRRCHHPIRAGTRVQWIVDFGKTQHLDC